MGFEKANKEEKGRRYPIEYEEKQILREVITKKKGGKKSALLYLRQAVPRRKETGPK